MTKSKPIGRPTNYDAKTVLKGVEAYLASCERNHMLPQVAGLAVHLGIWRSTVYAWAEKHPEFKDILEHILSLQEATLVNNSLKNEYNATISKLMLAQHHGYKDRQDITTGDKELPVPIINLNQTK